MKRFSTLIPFLALLLPPLLNAQLNTGNVQGFGWARGPYNLIQNVTINRMTFTGPADSLYYDILVSGLISTESKLVMDLMGQGSLDMSSQLVTPLPCKGQVRWVNNLKRTHWDLGFGISPMKGVFIILPQAATFLRSTVTQKIPISTPTPFLYKAWVMTVCLLK